MRVIVGCEFTQIVTKAFRARGHEAYSCDILPCEGGHPEWHLQEDILEVLKREQFDLGIFHPPCTYIANSGVRWLFEKAGRWEQLDNACKFFNSLYNAPIKKVCVENPRPHKWATEKIGKYSQCVQPYYFGEKQKKATCLWLKNLPPLMSTQIIYPPTNREEKKKWEKVWREPPGINQAKNRSKTFPKIANAIAEQWGITK